ncbi:uncharacterized protein LOC106640037 [Copidosoma floridanum]|uniref:uncharacterized protein LOC106640037 n=1 Tax=Copidosoma floridanum TaxID=29053 RepID=UPI0006C94015|nr:uncharacterized protein LOC106640037 [Copidosoma floridanum]
MRGQRVLPLLLVLLLAGVALPTVVLPRPPSSPNRIPRAYSQDNHRSKDYVEKAVYQQQSTNVEKPDTQDYRFVEIELRDGDNVGSLDLPGLVRAVLDNHPRRHLYQAPLPPPGQQRRFELTPEDEPRNLTYPQPEVVPRSILGVRDVGLGQRVFEPFDPSRQQQQRRLIQPRKDLGNEKLYYLKSSRPKVYVNFRGRTGNFRQDGSDSRAAVRLEPGASLRATQPYRELDVRKPKSAKRPPKKYDPSIHGGGTANSRTSSATTTENTMVTSSELPKQIPAPPSRLPSPSPLVHTTPVQRFTARRTDVLMRFVEP